MPVIFISDFDFVWTVDPQEKKTGRRWRNEGLFNNSKHMDALCLGFLYFLGASKEALATFSNQGTTIFVGSLL